MAENSVNLFRHNLIVNFFVVLNPGKKKSRPLYAVGRAFQKCRGPLTPIRERPSGTCGCTGRALSNGCKRAPAFLERTPDRIEWPGFFLPGFRATKRLTMRLCRNKLT